MSARVAMLCPSRDRAPQFADAVRSALHRATGEVEFYTYLDDDAQPYPPIDGVTVVCDRRVGSAQALNRLAEVVLRDKPDVQVLAMMTDDSIVTTPGWDEWLLREVSAASGGIAVLVPSTNGDSEPRTDMPAITRRFYDEVGFYAHPDARHYAWPSVLDALADGICLTKAFPEDFAILHRQAGSRNPSWDHDCEVFYQWYAWHKDQARAALRLAVAGHSLWSLP